MSATRIIPVLVLFATRGRHSRKAGFCLLDFLAACLRPRHLDWSRQALELVRRSGSRAAATLIGTDLQAAAAEAAFANATAGHGLIREDMHVASACHIG